jgi:hypothetical protein
MAEGYTKEDGKLEQKPVITSEVVPSPKDLSITERGLPENYSKKDGKLDPSLFIIVSGGEKREKDYFSIFQNTSTFPRIKIEFVATNSSGRTGLDVDELVPISILIKEEKEQSKGLDIIIQQ